jgi:hypothetical protein
VGRRPGSHRWGGDLGAPGERGLGPPVGEVTSGWGKFRVGKRGYNGIHGAEREKQEGCRTFGCLGTEQRTSRESSAAVSVSLDQNIVVGVSEIADGRCRWGPKTYQRGNLNHHPLNKEKQRWKLWPNA